MQQSKPLTKDGKALEGLLLCLLTAAAIAKPQVAEELGEVTRICIEEPEFSQASPQELEAIFAKAQQQLSDKPGDIIKAIKKLLTNEELRQRALEFAVRVVTSDGIVTPDQEAYLETLIAQLDLPADSLQPTLRAAQKRLVRFMIIYLVYLTATADGIVRPEEFEEMIPLALNLPVFKGVTTSEFAAISHSVRRNLQTMRDERGLEYITGTLLHAAAQLKDETIPEQALRLVARGIFADHTVNDDERHFFLQVADRLKVDRRISGDMVPRP